MSQEKPVGVFAGCVVDDAYIYLEQKIETADGKYDYVGAEHFIGGSAPNAAITFAHLNKNFGSNGDAILYSGFPDQFSGTLGDDFSASGVKARDCTQNPNFQLKENLVIVGKTGDRTGLRDKRPLHQEFAGMAVTLPDNLREQLKQDLAKADIFMMGTRYPALTLEIAKIARDMDVPVLLDAGAWREYLPALVEASDIVIASHDVELDGQPVEAQAILSWLKEMGVEHAAVTRGGKSTLYDSPQGAGETNTYSYGDVVDTNAAGDIQKGAFAFAFAQNGGDFVAALDEAAKVASWSVVHSGSRAGIKSYGIHPSTTPAYSNGTPANLEGAALPVQAL